jgi:hypothetical protein
MTTRTVLAALVSCGLGAACVSLDGEDQSTTIWETVLQSEPAYPDFSGQAAAVSGPQGTDVGVGIEGADPDASHAWALRTGACAAPGQQVGPDSDYPELTVSDTGGAESEAHLALRLSATGAYHVIIRVSLTDTSRVACGDLIVR